MPLVPLRPVLDAAVKYGYAQGAFNVNAVAQAEAVIRRCPYVDPYSVQNNWKP